MELAFNELSVTPLSTDMIRANSKMELFSKAVAAARKRGFRNIRTPVSSSEIILSDNYYLFHWLISKDVSEIYRNNLYGMLIQPFIKDEDDEIVEKYISTNYYFEDSENGFEKTECLGLTTAYLYNTIGVSLQSSDLWQRNNLKILLERGEYVETDSVLNIFSENCFTVKEIDSFIEQTEELVLMETDILPENKNVHFSSHHGLAELNAFSRRLRNSPYVIEMRSTNWGGSKFIRAANSKGELEIVLLDSERQYAVWVQTTGRNLRETKAIAEKIEEKYS